MLAFVDPALTEYPGDDVVDATRNAVLETQIRRHPDQYHLGCTDASNPAPKAGRPLPYRKAQASQKETSGVLMGTDKADPAVGYCTTNKPGHTSQFARRPTCIVTLGEVPGQVEVRWVDATLPKTTRLDWVMEALAESDFSEPPDIVTGAGLASHGIDTAGATRVWLHGASDNAPVHFRLFLLMLPSCHAMTGHRLQQYSDYPRRDEYLLPRPVDAPAHGAPC